MIHQPDRGTYNKNASMLEQFYHSCLGKLALAAVAVGVLALIAMLTIPSDEKISKETMDNVRECILQNDTIQSDQIDNTLSNVMRMFTSVPEEAFDRNLAKAIEKYNTLKIYHHTLYSTAYIHNNYRPEGSRVAIGILGMVIPTVNYSDLLLRSTVIRHEKDDPIIQSPQPVNKEDDDDMGEAPDLTPFTGKY